MPIPPFDQHGLLPIGVHDCNLGELQTRFGSFQSSDRRPRLFLKLQDFVAELQLARFIRYLLVDGSFVTAKNDPNDIDLVLVLPLTYALTDDLPPDQYRLISKRRVHKRFGFDMVVVRENTLEYDEAVAFFQQVRHQPALRKGLLRLQP